MLQIDIVNCVRRALEGRHQAVELCPARLSGDGRLQRLLLDAVLAAVPACDADCRQRLRLLLLRTAQHADGLMAALAQHGAGAALYPAAGQLSQLVQLHGDTEPAELPADPPPPAAAGIHDTVVEVRTDGGLSAPRPGPGWDAAPLRERVQRLTRK